MSNEVVAWQCRVAATCGSVFLALAVSTASCAQFHTTDDAPALAALATDVLPGELEQSLRAGVARDVLIELNAAASGALETSSDEQGAAGAPATADMLDGSSPSLSPGGGDREPAANTRADAGPQQPSNALSPTDAQSPDADRASPQALPAATRPSAAAARDVDSAGVDTDERLARRAAHYRAAQTRVLNAVEPRDLTLFKRYGHLPFMFVRVHTLAALRALARHGDVSRLHAERRFESQALASLPPGNLSLIGQPAVAASGMTGAGTAVAVLDTGADFRRSAFGSCASPGPACKVAFAADFARDDGVPDDLGHGTNVAAVALAVAPDAQVLALDVFDGPTAPTSAILAAIDWVIENRGTYNIVAMNMSFGAGRYVEPCADDLFASALMSARSAGILPVVASGNSAYSDALASPACAPAALSVGAVYTTGSSSVTYGLCADKSTRADQVACFSNSAGFLSLLAPGTQIAAGGLTLSGTSQAAPHVAGAFALIRAAWASESFAESVARLSQNGPLLTDPRNAVSTRRLDLPAATAATAIREVGPPVGELQINGGAVATNTRHVTLTLTGGGGVAPLRLCVSNDEDCDPLEAFTATRSWELTDVDGVKTVRVLLKDAAGRQSTWSASIRLDRQAPTGSSLRASAGAEQVSLSWSAASDVGSGVASYRLVYAERAAPSCNGDGLLYTGSARSFTHAAVTDGAIYGYRVCPIDAAGNVGLGSSVAARPAPEFEPPLGTLTINAGAARTARTSVTLSLAATDDNGVAAMCISNRATCSAWEPYAPERAWTLDSASSVAGLARVYAWFKDGYGNVTPTAVTASITLDAPETTRETFHADAATNSIRLHWSPADDASTVVGYTLVFARGTAAPEACSQGSVLYAGSARAYDHVGLQSGGSYSYRVCAFDRAGNLTRGVTLSAQPL